MFLVTNENMGLCLYMIAIQPAPQPVEFFHCKIIMLNFERMFLLSSIGLVFLIPTFQLRQPNVIAFVCSWETVRKGIDIGEGKKMGNTSFFRCT